jgi:hypothetical protein
MLKTVLVSALAAASGFAGWMGGSIWPAPPEWTDAVDRTATDLRARFRLERVSFDGLRDLLPAERFAEIKSEMTQLAVATGELIVVDRSPGTLEEQLDNLALDAASAVPDGMEVMTLPAAPPPAATAGATPEAGDRSDDPACAIAGSVSARRDAGGRSLGAARRGVASFSDEARTMPAHGCVERAIERAGRGQQLSAVRAREVGANRNFPDAGRLPVVRLRSAQ